MSGVVEILWCQIKKLPVEHSGVLFGFVPSDGGVLLVES